MIIITGGDGFIGSSLVPLIRKKYRAERIFLLTEPRYNLVTGKNLDKIPQNPRLVIHLAAATDTSKGDQRCNDIGTKNLLTHLTKIGPKTHFIFTSSQAVYSGRMSPKKPIDESTLTATNSAYGKTKLKAEKTLIEESKKRGFRLTIVRLPTVWGENPRKNSFLNFLRSLVKHDSIFSKIDWPGSIALINVTDAAKYLAGRTSRPPKDFQIIPIAVQNLTLAEIFEVLTVKEGKDYQKIILPAFIWNLAKFLRNYLGYFEPILPPSLYNYFWRASIVVDSPLGCKVNIKRGIKFTS